ncbi:MAG: hypothetical protein Q8K45_21020, partial [Rubrivivax sp.]|nr:hypothetical protein [Rubrivivax sp.]
MDTIDTMLGLQRRRLLGAAGAFGALALAGCTESRPTPDARNAAAASPRFSGQTMGSGYTVRLAGAALTA